MSAQQSMQSMKSLPKRRSISKYGCPYTDAPEFNPMAFVQTPQYFKKNELMEVDGDPLSHNNHAFFDSCLHSMDAYNSCMFVGTNVVWRREALDSVGGIQYGTISEDFWTGHMAHWLGWDSAYMRKDRQGKRSDRFRLCEGTAPDSAAASLTQRKRWHKGAVELFVGVKNIRDPSWMPPVARIPERPVPKYVRRYRDFHWFFARMAWVGSVIPPLFYTLLVVGGLWSNTLWIYLNPTPALLIMIPRLWLASFVPTLGDSNVPAEELLSSMPEYFTYAPIRLVGTIEAFQEKCTGKPAKWGNTGGVGRGSRDEIPNVLICASIFVGLVRSVFYWAFFDTDKEMYELVPIWLFGLIILQTYWRFARVSIQEYFDWPYSSLHGRMMFQWFSCAGIMTVTVLLMLRDDRLS
jgi:cellulose synthase (UDP-forming)